MISMYDIYIYKYIHTYIWLIFVDGKRSYIYLCPPTLGLTVHNSICSMWYGKTRPPGICLVKWARAELASTWWVSPLHYQWNKRCVRCKRLHESTKIPKTPVIWWIRYLTVQKKNRWSEADKSEFTTLDGYFLWDSPQLQKLRQKCPILEGKNSKNLSKRSRQGAETRAKEILVHFPSLSASSRSFWAALTCGKAARLRMDVANMDRTYGPNNFWSCKRQGPSIVHICAIFQT